MGKVVIHRNCIHYRMDDRLSEKAKRLLSNILDGHDIDIMHMDAYEELKFYGYITVTVKITDKCTLDDLVFDIYDSVLSTGKE